jgi:small-conductance mechanosensitive channel
LHFHGLAAYSQYSISLNPEENPMYSHRGLGIVAGIIWLAIGIFLLWRGLALTITACEGEGHLLVDMLALRFGTAQKAAVVLVATGLLVGYFKGRFVLRKTALRTIDRIRTLSNPTSLGKLYGIGSYLLVGAMIALGITLRSIGAAEEIRGVVLIAVGSALLQGSTALFRTVPTLAGQARV